MKQYKIYLDVCCLNRPFDDQGQLGPLGMVRFLQQYESGSGDYTREREQWLKDVELDDIFEKRAKRRGRFTP